MGVGGSSREEGGVACTTGAGAGGGGLAVVVVVFGGFVATGEEADFTKDADVAARTAGGALGGHFWVAMLGVVRVLAFASPEENGQCQEGEEGEDADDNSSDSATREAR